MIEHLQKLNATSLPTSFLDALLAILLAFALSYLVKLVYHSSTSRHTFDPHFNSIILFLAPVLSVIMMLIGSNLALSIGMVGSLSIIRFRNVIKSSRDMVYIFWLIAIGLGCGTFSYQLILISTLLIASVLYIYERSGKDKSSDTQLVLQGKGKIPLDEIRGILGNHRALHWQENENGWNYMADYSIKNSETELMARLRQIGVEHMAFHENS